jgi:RimJ/RimL family protein N-acetyltransferase
MKNSFLKTKRLILEPLTEKHLSDEYVSWLNDKEVCKYNRHATFPNTKNKTLAYINSLKDNPSSVVFAIIEKESSLHVGNIALQNIDFINSNADISIILGEKSAWGKSYATECYKAIIDYAFKILNLHRLYIGTHEKNIAMQRVAQKLGMRHEGTKKEAIFKDNRYYDVFLYGLLKDEYHEN